jgi:hypothetical protein
MTKAGEIARPPANVDLEIAILSPAQTLQPLPERADPGLRIRIALGDIVQHCYAARALCLLRERRERPRGSRAGNQFHKLAALHARHGLPPAQE